LKYFEAVEGTTKLLVPPSSLKDPSPPRTPVFFNPAASVNRDVSVAIVDAAGGENFCDSMAGVGSRGIRVANEVNDVEGVTLVDFNSEAMKVARRAAALNNVRGKCEFVVGEASAVLHSFYGRAEKFDFVDVDPFGTPMRQLPAAISATADGGIISVTATDTAALCGAYPRAALRRYAANPVNNHFHHETGIRILVNAVRRQAAQIDVGISPVAAHSTRHYVRVFIRLIGGASKADASQGHEGYVVWCPSCGTTGSSRAFRKFCSKCGKKAKVAGPLWVGRLTEDDVIERAAAAAGRRGLRVAAKILASLPPVAQFPPWSFSIDGICSLLGKATVKEANVRTTLADAGYDSCRQPFEKTGIKTDAPYEVVIEAVRRLAG
jgi:tRNA (guanine26-N2/guanine27-N2)-dimethyltransferase